MGNCDADEAAGVVCGWEEWAYYTDEWGLGLAQGGGASGSSRWWRRAGKKLVWEIFKNPDSF